MNRYARQEILPEFSAETQLLIGKAKILVIGAGALGCPVLQYLVAAGIGKITVIDPDVVAIHNLHRQILYTENEIGLSKAICAVNRLKNLNSEVELSPLTEVFNAENALELVNENDVIIDCSDNFPTRYLVNDACGIGKKPLIHASILGFEGQFAVFNTLQKDGSRSGNYRDLFPEPPNQNEVKNCAEAGVIGALPGILGSMQALEAIKLITGIGTLSVNKIIFLNCLTMNFRTFSYQKNENRGEIENLHPFSIDCAIPNETTMKSINVLELKELIDLKADFVLIDVREPFEFETGNLGGILIPMNTIPERFEEIPKDKPVIVHCKAGSRSANVIAYLEQNHGYTNLSNLAGGIMDWKAQIDPSINY